MFRITAEMSWNDLKPLEVRWRYYNESNYWAKESKKSHIHPFYELYIYISGNVSFVVDNNRYELQKGDMIFTEPNQWHRCIYHADTVHEHFCLFISGLSPRGIATGKLIRFSPAIRDKVLAICQNLNKRLCEKASFGFAECYELFSLFYHVFEDADFVAASSLPQSLRDISQYLREHLSEPISINEMANKFHLSQSSLERQFKKYFHITPYTYLRELRMAHACTLLQSGISVTDTSIECGYNDCSQFIHQFKKRFGETPLQYSRNALE